MICGAAVINFAQMGPKRHPLANRPLIYYDLALVFQPMVLAGTTIGVLLNGIFPEWLILILLMTTLTISTVKTTLKGIRQYKQENEDRKKIGIESSSNDGSVELLTLESTTNHESLDLNPECMSNFIS